MSSNLLRPLLQEVILSRRQANWANGVAVAALSSLGGTRNSRCSPPAKVVKNPAWSSRPKSINLTGPGFLKFFLSIYDNITLPLYWSRQQPHKKIARVAAAAASWRQTAGNGWKQDTSPDNEVYKELILKNKVDTLDKVWNNSVKRYNKKPCLGTRKVFGEEAQDGGFKKLDLGEYEWQNYEDAYNVSLSFGHALRRLGQQPKMPIAIYAETKQEWLLSALGAFSQSIIVSTLYTNLGEDAVCHGINETQVSVVVTSHALLPKFKRMLHKCPNVKHVIFIEDQVSTTSTEGFKSDVEIMSFQSAVKLGQEYPVASNPPDAKDLAIIMYTSGSTGVPKGVMLSHRNLVATSTCILFLHRFTAKDCYIAYLPLAHVLELLSECTMLLLGVPIGYSSPYTMTDASSAIKAGQRGDASLLKPTVMCTVPLIMDNIYKKSMEGISKKGKNFQNVFQFCYDYKLKWNKRGYETPVLDKMVFNKLRMILGGRVDFVIVGSAPLSANTQEFMRTCFGMNLVQGYSMTETTCSGCCQVPGAMEVGVVGGPMAGMEIRLINWEEGNYKITDKPYPRGEIVLGGKPVARGYYKNEEKTAEDFFVENGKQFFKSGDIGELLEDGTIRLIDRKKDLVKLQLGEYVSLGKVEAHMKTNPLVDNICVYADPYKSHTVALIVPVRDIFLKIAGSLNKAGTLEDLCNDSDLVQFVLNTLVDHGKSNGLEKFEIPTAITLCPQVWMPESGLVTASFKLKRKAVQDTFQSEIDRMYIQIGLTDEKTDTLNHQNVVEDEELDKMYVA